MLRTHLTVEMRAVLQLAIGIDNDDASSVSEILELSTAMCVAKEMSLSTE